MPTKCLSKYCTVKTEGGIFCCDFCVENHLENPLIQNYTVGKGRTSDRRVRLTGDMNDPKVFQLKNDMFNHFQKCLGSTDVLYHTLGSSLAEVNENITTQVQADKDALETDRKLKRRKKTR